MSAFLKGRKQEKVYSVFFDRFVCCITGKTWFKSKIKEESSDQQEICTASDEAFTLLLLENSYERWADIYKNTGGRPIPLRGIKNCQWQSDVKTKYTDGGIQYSSTDTHDRVGKGWSTEGIKRFNELFEQVKQDQKEHPEFVKIFIENKKKQITGTKRKREVVMARHELWEDRKEPDVMVSDILDQQPDVMSDDEYLS